MANPKSANQNWLSGGSTFEVPNRDHKMVISYHIMSYLVKLGVIFGGPQKIWATPSPHEFPSGFVFLQFLSDSGYSSSQDARRKLPWNLNMLPVGKGGTSTQTTTFGVPWMFVSVGDLPGSRGRTIYQIVSGISKVVSHHSFPSTQPSHIRFLSYPSINIINNKDSI